MEICLQQFNSESCDISILIFSNTLSVNRKEQEQRAKAETLDQIRLEQAVKQQEEEKQKQHAQE